MKALLITLFSLMLSACATTPTVQLQEPTIVTRVEFLKPTITPDMFTLTPLPAPMDKTTFMGLPESQRIAYIANYSLDVMANYKECKIKLDTVQKSLQDFDARSNALEASQSPKKE